MGEAVWGPGGGDETGCVNIGGSVNVNELRLTPKCLAAGYRRNSQPALDRLAEKALVEPAKRAGSCAGGE